jgi:hypothetical protein
MSESMKRENVRKIVLTAEFDRLARGWAVENGWFRPLDSSEGAFRAVAPNGEVWELPERVMRRWATDNGWVEPKPCGECEGTRYVTDEAQCRQDCKACKGTGREASDV